MLVTSPWGRVLTLYVQPWPLHAYSVFHLHLPCQLLFVNNLPDLTEQELNIQNQLLQQTWPSVPCPKPFKELHFLYYLYIGFCCQGTSQFNCGLFLAPFSFPFPSLPSTAPFKGVCSLCFSSPPTLVMIVPSNVKSKDTQVKIFKFSKPLSKMITNYQKSQKVYKSQILMHLQGNALSCETTWW